MDDPSEKSKVQYQPHQQVFERIIQVTIIGFNAFAHQPDGVDIFEYLIDITGFVITHIG